MLAVWEVLHRLMLNLHHASSPNNIMYMSLVPLAPNNVQAESGLRSVTVTWSPPLNVQSLTVEYEVRISQVTADPNVNTTVRVADGALSVIAGPLSAFTEYNVSVRACSQVGCGPFSPTIQQVTLEEGELFNQFCYDCVYSIVYKNLSLIRPWYSSWFQVRVDGMQSVYIHVHTL